MSRFALLAATLLATPALASMPGPHAAIDAAVRSSARGEVPAFDPGRCSQDDARVEASVAQRAAGRSALALGDVDEAVQHYTAAVTVHACNALAWRDLGTVLLAEGRPTGAVDALTTAVHLNRSDADAWTLLGEARLRAGDRDGARDAFHEALILAPELHRAEAGLHRALRG